MLGRVRQSAGTLRRAGQTLVGHPVAKGLWGTLVAIGLLLGLVASVIGIKTFIGRQPKIEKEKAALSIEGAEGMESAIALHHARSNPSGASAELRWTPAFHVRNVGSATVVIKDIQPLFPHVLGQVEGQWAELVRTNSSKTITVYATVGEAVEISKMPDKVKQSNARFDRARDRPLALPSGTDQWIMYGQAFELRTSRGAVPLSDEALLPILGTYFNVRPDAQGRYGCIFATVQVRVVTSNGSFVRPTKHFLGPDGCSLRISKEVLQEDDLTHDQLGDR